MSLVAKDYEALIRYGYVERRVPNDQEADVWRAEIRAAARADRIAVRTHKVCTRQPDHRCVIAEMPNHTMSDEDKAEQDDRVRAAMNWLPG